MHKYFNVAIVYPNDEEEGGEEKVWSRVTLDELDSRLTSLRHYDIPVEIRDKEFYEEGKKPFEGRYSTFSGSKER